MTIGQPTVEHAPAPVAWLIMACGSSIFHAAFTYFFAFARVSYYAHFRLPFVLGFMSEPLKLIVSDLPWPPIGEYACGCLLFNWLNNHYVIVSTLSIVEWKFSRHAPETSSSVAHSGNYDFQRQQHSNIGSNSSCDFSAFGSSSQLWNLAINFRR